MKDNNLRSRMRFIRDFVCVTCLFTALTVFIGHTYGKYSEKTDTDALANAETSATVIVIDPGHGGEDGGAIAADGTIEKDLNLEFGKTLHSVCGVLGMESALTRESDTLLYDKYGDLTDYKGKKKVYDLKNRLRFTEEAGDETIFIGIHMNKFSDSKYSGTQVYYSPNDADSMTLADLLQNKVKAALQPENDRAIKKAGSSIYLLKRLEVPAVLTECGFLSNEAETARLKSSEYKKEFSLTTAVALGEFINSRNS